MRRKPRVFSRKNPPLLGDKLPERDTASREQAAKQDWGVRFEIHWLPPNASWLDQIEIWFSILQRKLLQPNHFVSVAALEKAIADFIARYNQSAKPIKWSYTIEKLEQKLGTHL
jgi:hypothetical protein